MDTARENSILVIAASIIGVIRLRGGTITRSSKVVATISNSVQLARMVLDAVERGKRGHALFLKANRLRQSGTRQAKCVLRLRVFCLGCTMNGAGGQLDMRFKNE